MAKRKRNDISLQFPCLSPGGRAIKHVGGRRQYPVPNTIVSYNLDTSSWSSFSLQPGPSTPLDPAAGPPPFDQALINGNRMTLFSHPLLKAFHVNSRCDGVNILNCIVTWLRGLVIRLKGDVIQEGKNDCAGAGESPVVMDWSLRLWWKWLEWEEMIDGLMLAQQAVLKST